MDHEPVSLDHLVTAAHHPPPPSPSRFSTDSTKMGKRTTSSPRSSKPPSPSTPIFTPSTAAPLSPHGGGGGGGGPCLHSDGTTPVCWDCAEAGHPGAIAAIAVAGAGRQRVRSKASSLFSVGRRSSHSTLQVHPAEPGLEVCVSDYRHLRQPGLEVATGPRVVDPVARYGGPRSSTPLRRLCGADTDSEKDFRGVSAPRRICGVRRRWFVVGSVGALLVLLAIILGVVFGVVMKSKETGGTQAPPSSYPNASSPSDASSPYGSGGTGPVTCPTADGTTYAVAGTSTRYKITCRSAPAGGDIASFEAGTFAECLGLCAKTQGCVGVSWINEGRQGTDNNYCFTKSDMSGKPTTSDGTQSARLV